MGYGLSKISIDEEADAPDEMAIYIKTNGVHTDIILPVKTEQINWSKLIKQEQINNDSNTYEYIAFGWGDKGFYLETPTWSELKFSTAFKATTGLGTTAMHTTYYNRLQENSNCRKIMISKEQYARIISHIEKSFKKDENGFFIKIKTNAHYGYTDAFYEGTGSYSLFKTCNSWANETLKVSGQKACLWTALDSGIFEKYD